jgi:hypothetical protein
MNLPAWLAGGRGEFVPASPRAASSTRNISRDHWKTTTFRWFTAYAAIFSLAFMALLGVIEYSVTRAMIRETDSGLRWQLRYFDSRSDAALTSAIDVRLTRPNRRENFYGLFAPDGRWLAGDIVSCRQRSCRAATVARTSTRVARRSYSTRATSAFHYAPWARFARTARGSSSRARSPTYATCMAN